MNMARMMWIVGLIVVVGVSMATDVVAAPWDALLSRNRVSADPNQSYRLTQEQGPWMIAACSFSGQTAEEEARELALELRERYKVEAYVYGKRFDLEKETFGRGLDSHGNVERRKYQRGTEFEEWAVMVGNFDSVHDSKAQSTLRKLKFSQPRCLEVAPDRSTTRNLAGLRYVQQEIRRRIRPADDESSQKGPLGHAMLTTNPLLANDLLTQPGIDLFIIKLNRDVPNSLLNNPGKFTVQVARFTGQVVIDQNEIRRIREGGRMTRKLDEAGDKAEILCRALRMKEYEAYVLHDHNASIVTIGSFDSVGTPRSDGRTEINPEIHRIIETFRAQAPPQHIGLPSTHLASMPKMLVDIPVNGKRMDIHFDVQPIPVRVPKPSIASALTRVR